MGKFLNWLKENWRAIRISHVFYSLLIIIILYFVSGEILYHYRQTRLDKLSPKKIMNLYSKGWFRGDYESLEKIIHPDSGIHVNKNKPQWQKREESALRVFGIILGGKSKAVYQKIIDSNTAEVGSVHYSIYWPFVKRPVSQDILKKHDGIWKVFGLKWVPGEMLEELKKNPTDLSLYYHHSRDVANNQNRLLAYRFRKKYYELDPDGFWITEHFIERLKVDEENYETNYENYEKQLLAEIEDCTGSWASLHKARKYITLARILMFHQDYQKAEHCLNQAENASKKDQHTKDSFDHAWNELQLRKEGKYIDPLDELDRLRAAQELNL
ncbi:MAG: hypothetical protein ACYSU8_09705 [Planctomycetota bacterium]